MKKIAIALLIFVAATEARAVFIGFFPGLDALIEQADAIVILRVDEHIAPHVGPNLYSTHRCFIYQSLKGDIPAGSRIPLQLMDPRTPFVTPFALYSTHLVFLTKKRSPGEATDYRTLEIQGASVRVSPFGNESMPEGTTTAGRIHSLIRTAMTYWADEEKKEHEFLRSILSGEKTPNKTPEGTP